MPHSRMRPCIGSMPKETGIRIAIALIGPIPGRTPQIVPRRTPRSAKSRLAGWIAVSNPPARSTSVSTAAPSADQSGREEDAQAFLERDIDDDCEQDGVEDVPQPCASVVDHRESEEERCRRDDEAQRDEKDRV